MLKVPIILLVFNRPEVTARVLDCIRSVRPQQLLIVADGPRETRTADRENCVAVRRLIEAGIDWPCDVQRNYTERNLGCGARVASGLTWAFGQVDRAIVLEDDCLPAPLFFDFCLQLLDHYAEEPRVGAICGSNFQSRDRTAGAGYYFSRYSHCWGWATWRRAWQRYDYHMADWPEVKRSGWLRSRANSDREAEYWEKIFDRTHRGELETWAYQWLYANWRANALAVLPATNLVTNIGFGAAATHTRKIPAGSFGRTWNLNQPWPLRHPRTIERNLSADRYTQRHHYDPSIWTRAWRKLTG